MNRRLQRLREAALANARWRGRRHDITDATNKAFRQVYGEDLLEPGERLLVDDVFLEQLARAYGEQDPPAE